MKIIEIAVLPNGAHRNQTLNRLTVIPEGWAVIPVNVELPNFPFGEVTVEEVAGVMTVTAWTPGVVPEPAPEPEETAEPTVWDELDAAYREGVNGAYDQ